MSLRWYDRVNDWKPLPDRSSSDRPTMIDDADDADWRPRQRTGDHWQGVLRGWADSVLHHQAALAGLNRRHQEFWRRKS
jgi:hypothetical protein